ncbi:cation:proton antiporter [Prosthecobacter sp. SYSU 5D2]|uniref:cation:proton antiporter n=1 Tax=Prosthecobacter sp. SYSU 5D2 TaxID=3134134 RepID=UPI0031FE8102
MDTYILSLAIIGFIGLAVSWVPTLAQFLKISYSIVFLLFGVVVYSLTDIFPWPSPLRNESFTVHLSELIVIIALMGTGLKIDRGFNFRNWNVPFRLISVAMLLSIGSLAFLGYWWAGLPLASALLLAASLAPTDPVLAADVQVDEPNKGTEDPTRFSLTAEAGLNDGMAFPFVWMAVAMAAAAQTGDPWFGKWLVYDLLYRVAAGVAMGYGTGKAVIYLFFHLPAHHKLLKVREGMVAVSATLLVYGLTELAQGYGFIAVFIAAITIRNHELKHQYHSTLHTFIDQVERILLSVILVLFGGSLATGILAPLTWEMALLGLGFVFVLRPLSGFISLIGTGMNLPHKFAVSFFGIRGVGSFFYLSFGLKEAEFENAPQLWALTAFIVLVSIIVHGSTAPVIIQRVRQPKVVSSGG